MYIYLDPVTGAKRAQSSATPLLNNYFIVCLFVNLLRWM